MCCHTLFSVGTDVDDQRLKDYQRRMTNWIGRQGILFQIRYIRLARPGSFFSLFLGLAATVGLVLVVLLGLAFGGLKYYQTTKLFEESLDEQLVSVLGAEDLEAKGFQKSGSKVVYQRLLLKGGDRAFFYDGVLVGLSGALPFFAGAWGNWAPETVSVERAEFLLKAGGRREEMANAMSSILGSLKDSSLKRIKIAELNCEWGYSKLTFGGFYDTSFDASLRDGRWVIALNGGYFRQNWLGPFEVESGLLSVGEEGIVVDSLVLRQGEGRLTLSGTIGGPLEMPELNLTGTFTRFPVERMVKVEGVRVDRFIEGSVSGDLRITGSTNRRVRTAGTVVLGEDDQILIRDEWKLLRAISAVTGDGTYLRIAFDRGGFDFASEGGHCEVSNIDLTSKRMAKLTGELTTRLISQEEAAEFLDIPLTDGFSRSLTDTSAAQDLEDDRISIKRAARGGDEEFGIRLDLEMAEGPVGKPDRRAVELKGLRLKREMAKPRYGGELRLAVPERVLLENEKVASNYAADEDGWSWIPVECEDDTFTTLSRTAADKLLREGRAYREGIPGTPGTE